MAEEEDAEPRPLWPWQHHPTEREKRQAEREAADRERGKTAPTTYRVVRGSRAPPGARFCSGGLPSLGKRR